MPRVTWLLLLAACTSYEDLTIDPSSGPALGVGLAQRFTTQETECENTADPDCFGGTTPMSLSVHASGGAVTVSDVGGGAFVLTGVAAGTAVVDVTGDGAASTSVTIPVVDVGSTALFASRAVDLDPSAKFRDVPSPVQAFAQASIVIDQASTAAEGSPLAGNAALALAAGTTDGSYDPTCGCVATGTRVGEGELSAPHGTMVLDVVDPSAIADFTINGSDTSTVSLQIDDIGKTIYLIPTDADGRPIVGLGPRPTFTVADPSIAKIYLANEIGVVRPLTVIASSAGTTTFDLTWGPVRKTFTVMVP